jgi:hypothetical protein
MGSAVYLLIAVIVTFVGSIVVYLVNRTSTSVESGIDDFRREMQALAPQSDDDEPWRSRES